MVNFEEWGEGGKARKGRRGKGENERERKGAQMVEAGVNFFLWR